MTFKATTRPDVFRHVSFALDRLADRNAPYSAAERWVVLMIVRRMRLNPADGEYASFPSMRDIARRSGLNVSTVKRLLKAHCDGPLPLLCRTRPGETFGRRHRSYRFVLVRHPEAFARARDQKRLAENWTRRKANTDSKPTPPSSISIAIDHEEPRAAASDCLPASIDFEFLRRKLAEPPSWRRRAN